MTCVTFQLKKENRRFYTFNSLEALVVLQKLVPSFIG